MFEEQEVDEQVEVEPVEPQQEARQEIDISKYVEPLRQEIDGLKYQLDPERNAQIFRQQQIAQQHRQRLQDFRLAAEQGDREKAFENLPYFVSAFDQAIGNLYQQQQQMQQYREEVQQRFELDGQAMAEERYFAARDPEGHGMLQEYPLHVARAIAWSEGRQQPNQQDVQRAMEHMEGRFAYHQNVQAAMDEMAGYVRQVKGSSVQKQPVKRFPTAVPAVPPSRAETQNDDPEQAYARMWAS